MGEKSAAQELPHRVVNAIHAAVHFIDSYGVWVCSMRAGCGWSMLFVPSLFVVVVVVVVVVVCDVFFSCCGCGLMRCRVLLILSMPLSLVVDAVHVLTSLVVDAVHVLISLVVDAVHVLISLVVVPI